MAAHQGPPSLGFSRQEHWSGLPFPSPMHESEKWKWSRSVVSDPQRPHGLQPTRLLRPWDFPGKSTGVGWQCLFYHKFLVVIRIFQISILKCLKNIVYNTLAPVLKFQTLFYRSGLLVVSMASNSSHCMVKLSLFLRETWKLFLAFDTGCKYNCII